MKQRSVSNLEASKAVSLCSMSSRESVVLGLVKDYPGRQLHRGGGKVACQARRKAGLHVSGLGAFTSGSRAASLASLPVPP